MTYQDRLLSHLIEYKHTVLDISQPGVFPYRGADVPREHILPIEYADLNLLPLARELERSLTPSNVRGSRHKYFHHLNSSQAFAFNLFLPFFGSGAAGAAALLRTLGQTAQLTHWELESIPVAKEGTNLDALWVTSDGATTLCEVKLSESKFGTAEDDDRHRTKLERIYRPDLSSHVDRELLEFQEFSKAYQILRNVWHLIRLDGSRLVFLLPQANERLWSELSVVLERIEPTTRSRISIAAIEDVLGDLARDPTCPVALRLYADQLIAKYVPS